MVDKAAKEKESLKYSLAVTYRYCAGEMISIRPKARLRRETADVKIEGNF